MSRMVDLTQGMLGEAMAALIGHDAAQAATLHLVFRELASLHGQALEELAGALAEERLTPQAAFALTGATQRLERIGNEVLDLANQVRHLAIRNGQ